MKFRVTLAKEGGGSEERDVDAPSRFAVYELLQKEGRTVTALEEDKAFKLPSWLSFTFGTGIKKRDIITMIKNMSAMLTAGLSLSRALSVIERQSPNKRLQVIASGLDESVKKGSSFHEALALYPKVFSGLFVAMAKAGEESGGLAGALQVVAIQMERSDELQRKVKGAMIYPSIVVSAILVVGVLMLIYVVPTLTKTFTTLGVKLPLTTKIIVVTSDFMAANAIVTLVSLALIFIGIFSFVKSRPGSKTVLWIALRLPIIGELVRETFSARAARTLSSLLASGVPVLTALGIAREVVQAEVFSNVIKEAEARVQKGDQLSSAFAEHPELFPLLMSDMLSVGEETGKVAEMLGQIAEFYESDVSEKTKDLSTIIEPVLMLIIGVFVGIFAVSMIAPIYSLSSAI